MKTISCPLCEGEEITFWDKVRKDELLILYHKMTKEDFSYLIYEDLDYLECKICKLKFFNPLITGDEKLYESLKI